MIEYIPYALISSSIATMRKGKLQARSNRIKNNNETDVVQEYLSIGIAECVISIIECILC